MFDLVYLQPIVEEGVLDNEQPSCSVQVDVSPNREVELSVKVIFPSFARIYLVLWEYECSLFVSSFILVHLFNDWFSIWQFLYYNFWIQGMLQPLEVTFDAEFFLSFIEFFDVLKSLSFQHDRVSILEQYLFIYFLFL